MIFLSISTLTLFNINADEDKPVYIHSLFFLLQIFIIILHLGKKEKVLVDTKSLNYWRNILLLLMSIIYVVYLYQILFLDILDLNLFTRNLITFVTLGLLLYFISILRENGISFSFIEKLIVYFSLINSIISLFQYILNKKLLLYDFNSNIEYYEGTEVVKRVVGLVGVNNGAGNLGAILFPILLYIFFKNKKVIYGLAIVLNLVFTILTLTRIAYLSILVSTLIIFLLFKPSYKKILLRFILLIIITLVIIIGYQLFYNDMYNILFLYRGDTGSYRIFQFYYAGLLLKDYFLFGIGSGNFNDVVSSIYGIPNIGVLHSQWLNILVEQGFLSFIGFLIFNILLLYILVKNGNIKAKWFPISLFISNFIVVNFNPNQYYELNIYFYYFVFFAYVFLYDGKDGLKQDRY
jgi:O-antigen ligase